MTIITKKVRLIAAPEPEGTFLGVRIPEGDLRLMLYKATTVDGAMGVTVDWGDGTRETVAEIDNLVHDYPAAGAYVVTISDDVDELCPFNTSGETLTYKERLVSVRATARRFVTTANFGFSGLPNLREVSLPNVRTLWNGVFSGSAGLVGELCFPSVAAFGSAPRTMPFKDCPGVTVIRFAKSNEAAIRASSFWEKDQQLGAENAVVRFDL